MTFTKTTVGYLAILVLLLYAGAVYTFASPPGSPYTVADNITDPSCAPNALNCYVNSVLADNGLVVSGSTVQLGGSLTQNTTIDQNGFNFIISQPVLSLGGTVVTAQGPALINSFPGTISGYLVPNGDVARHITWVNPSGAIATLSGSGDPTFVRGGAEMTTFYNPTDTTSAELVLHAYDTPNGNGTRIVLDPDHIDFQFSGNAEFRIGGDAGSSGYVLTSHGSGSAPVWQVAPIAINGTTIYSAGFSSTGSGGLQNIFLGDYSGNSSSATNSVFLGQNAGQGATSASTANFLGLNAGQNASGSWGANFLGENAGYGATAAYLSNFLGRFAGSGATSASYSNFFGLQAGQNATNASDSNFLGVYAGMDASGASNSNFLGRGSGTTATNASNSNFLGLQAGQNATNAQYSNFLGFQSGYNATNAANSIFIGKNAGYGDTVNNTVSGSSIAIGDSAGTGGFSNSIALGASAVNTSANQLLIGSSYTKLNVRGIDYTWPSTQAAGSGYVLTNDGAGGLSWSTGLSIGGTNGQLQYNNAGALGGVNGVTFDGTNFDAKDNVFRIVDNSDTTKRAIFEVSGIDAGTTRTYTFPNTAGTIALTSDFSGYLKNSIGISGGTTLVGGTASGENLTLSSTSNATKGKILFGTSAYDEANNRLGIGTNSPSVGDFGSTFTVKGTGSEIGIITAQRNVSAVANGTGFQTVLNNASSNPVTYSYFNGYIITNTAGAESGGLMFFTRNAGTLGARMTILNDGNTGIGTTSPTAYLHLKAGTATAGTAPLKLTSGTNLTTPENGTFEYDGSSLFFTRSGTLRAGLLMTDTASPFNTYSQSAKGATAFTSGTDNFLGGQLAGGALTAGSQNVMIGTQAGNLANAGLSQAVFLGYFAGQSASGITTGSVFVGSQAGQNGAGSYNSNFIGQLAGFNASNAYHSNLFGYQAGYGINANNVNFFGQNAGYGATSASYSNFFGQNAGANATSATNSNFFGYQSGLLATNASYSNFLGQNAGNQATNAKNSIFIGTAAGNSDTVNNTGNADDFSILIGNNTSTGGFSNSIALGSFATNTATNQLMIGSTTRRIDTLVFNGGTGNTCSLVTSTGITCSSDERLKTNILDLTNDTLDKLLTLKTVTYNWKTDPMGTAMVGFIAQDLQTQFPQLVSQNIDGMLSVNYAQMTPILVEALREMNLKIITINDLTKENTWRDAIVSWLGNASNGIQKIFTKEVQTDKLCVGQTCVTESQLQQLLQAQNIQSIPPVNSPTTSDPLTCTAPQVLNQTGDACIDPITDTPPAETPPVEDPVSDTPTDTQ